MKRLISIILVMLLLYSASYAEESAKRNDKEIKSDDPAGINEILNNTVGGISELVNGVSDWYSTGTEWINTKKDETYDFFAGMAENALDWAENSYGTVSDALSEKIVETVSVISAFMENIADAVSQFLTDMKQYFSELAQNADSLMTKAAQNSAVSFVRDSAEDVVDIIKGKMSRKQLAKNLSTGFLEALCGLGGFAGLIGGAVLGSPLGPVGDVIGGLIGGALGIALGRLGLHYGADLISNLFPEDDRDEMLKIISDELASVGKEYRLSNDETKKVMERLENCFSGDAVKDMYASEDRAGLAGQLLIPIIEKVIAERDGLRILSADGAEVWHEEAPSDMTEGTEGYLEAA